MDIGHHFSKDMPMKEEYLESNLVIKRYNQVIGSLHNNVLLQRRFKLAVLIAFLGGQLGIK